MNNALVKLELLRLSRSNAAKAILLFALLASLYAIWTGQNWRNAHNAALTGFQQQIDNKMQTWLQTLKAIESKEHFASPMEARPSMIDIAATHPVGPLGHMAVGSAELLPARVNVSPLNNQNLMVGRYGFENPTTLTLGRFDLAFFCIVVLPLLMIALSFDVLAADSARGTINLLLSNRTSKRRIIITRLLIRNSLLVGITAFASIVGFLLADSDVFAFAILWFAVLMIYSAFWLGLIYFIVSKFVRSETTAASLVSLWTILVFAIPALANSAGEAIYPLPSNLSYLSDARAAQNDAWKKSKEITASYLLEHPELEVKKQESSDFFHTFFVANEHEISHTADIISKFNQSHLNRSAFIEKLQYLSPAIIAQRAFFKVAGSDFDRALSFQAQTRQALIELNDELRPFILSSNRISSEHFETLSKFKFAEKTPRQVLQNIVFPMTSLLVFMLLLVRLGRAKSQYSPLNKII